MRKYIWWFPFLLLLLICLTTARRMPLLHHGGISSGVGRPNDRHDDFHQHYEDTITSPRQSSRTSSDIISSSPLFQHTSRRTACGVYLWDAPSALLFFWTNHLLKDCIIEGRGGRKFVRIEPGSILQLLYPSRKRYSPDKCMLCGGSFRDHLLLWWTKCNGLYTPFDLQLDRVYQTGVETYAPAPPKEAKAIRANRKSNHGAHNSHPSFTHPRVRFQYHRKYVSEGEDIHGLTESKSNVSMNRTRDRDTKNLGKRNSSPSIPSDDRFEVREIPLTARIMRYTIPLSKTQSLAFSVSREIVLNACNNLIRLQDYEQQKREEMALKSTPLSL